mgnify:CR=1 FL=1
MAKVTRPLLSLSASGAFAHSLIFQGTGARSTVKKWASPAQPRPISVTTRRTHYRNTATAWNALSEQDKEAWRQAAKPRHITGYNAYLSSELKNIPSVVLWDGGAASWDAGAAVWI